MNLNFFIILIFIIFILLYKKNEGFSNWKMYQELPLGNIKTGSSPLSYYEFNRYRKPYRYPVCYMKSYPIQHCSHFD